MPEPTRARRSWIGLLAGVAVAGGVGWLVDTTLLWVLDTRVGVSTPVAAAIGFIASGVVNFLINRVVFHGGREPNRGQLCRYLVLFLLNLIVVSVVVPLLAHAFTSAIAREGIRLVAAKLLTTAALLPLNALAYHRWVFLTPADHVEGDTSG